MHISAAATDGAIPNPPGTLLPPGLGWPSRATLRQSITLDLNRRRSGDMERVKSPGESPEMAPRLPGANPDTSSTLSSIPHPAENPFISTGGGASHAPSGYAQELGKCVGDFAATLAHARDELLHDVYAKEIDRLTSENLLLKSSLAAAESGNGSGENSPAKPTSVKFRPTVPSGISVQQRLQAAVAPAMLGEGSSSEAVGLAMQQLQLNCGAPTSSLSSVPFSVAGDDKGLPLTQMRSTASELMMKKAGTDVSAAHIVQLARQGSPVVSLHRRTTPMLGAGMTDGSMGSVTSPTSVSGYVNAIGAGESHLSLRVPLTRALETGIQLANQAGLQPQSRSQSRMLHKERQDAIAKTLSSDLGPRGWRRFMLEPDSVPRALWETMSLVALVYDSVLFPYVLAWNPTQDLFMSIGMWTTLMIWTIDLGLNFITGYIKGDGSAEMSPSKVVGQYLRTWFLCDFLTVVGDWLSTGLELANEGRQNMTDAVRLLRIFKVNRLMRSFTIGIRLVRFSKRLSLSSRINLTASPALAFGVQALKILGVILWINHLFTCVWFGIGASNSSDTGESWLDTATTMGGGPEQAEVPYGTYRQSSVLYQYTTAMHWSMTQMTPGSMQVFPTNSTERICNIVCLVFGLLFGTTLIGQLSSKLVQFNMNRQEELRRTGLLRQFLKENHIPGGLAARVYKQVTDRMSQRKRLTEDKVPGIAALTVNLRMELRSRLYMARLSNHPLFSAWSQMDATVLKDLCCFGSVGLTCLSSGEELFTPSSEDNCAYLFAKGSLKYIASGSGAGMTKAGSHLSQTNVTFAQNDGKAAGTEEDAPRVQAMASQVGVDHAHHDIQLEEGAWVSEISLYMTWQHLGTCESVKESELLKIPYEGFLQIMRNHHHCKVSEMTFDWCMAFHSQTEGDHDVDYTLFDIGVEHARIVMSMHERSRKLLHTNCIEHLEMMMTGNWLKGKGLSDLEEELKKGASVLTIDGKGEFVRTVTVCVARLQYQGRFMAQLAKKGEDGAWHVSVMLPGTKLKQGEDAGKVVESVLEEDLSKFAELAKFESCAQEAEKKESGSYGVKSQYLKLIFTATLDILPEDLNTEVREYVETVTMMDMQLHVMEDKKGRPILYGWVTPEEMTQLQAGLYSDEIRSLGKIRPSTDSSGNGNGRTRPSLQQRILNNLHPEENSATTTSHRIINLFVNRHTIGGSSPGATYEDEDDDQGKPPRLTRMDSTLRHLKPGTTESISRAMSMPVRGKPRITTLSASHAQDDGAPMDIAGYHWEASL